LEAYLRGEFDDKEFVRRDVALWHGVKKDLHKRDLEAIFEVPPFMPGVKETVDALRSAGVEMCICSGGIDLMAERVAQHLGIHHVAANGFVYDEGGFLTGEGVVRVPLNDKAAAPIHFSEELGIPLEDCLAIGNSMPDASMFDVVGRSIAFHPEDQYTRDHATWTIEDGPLTKILPLVLPLMRPA
jgi:HAD superfamily PSPase-like hydrolase